MIDTTKFIFGSVKWQNAMLDNILEKQRNNIELSEYEHTFISIQTEHQNKLFDLKRFMR